MFMMVGAMYVYVLKFPSKEIDTPTSAKDSGGKEEGILEGFYLFYEHDYIKGIFAVSSLYMVQVTVIDYMVLITTLLSISFWL